VIDQGGQPFVQHAPLIADPLGVFCQSLLAPAAVDACNSAISVVGVVRSTLLATPCSMRSGLSLQGCVVDAFTGQKHHHELGRRGQSPGCPAEGGGNRERDPTRCSAGRFDQLFKLRLQNERDHACILEY